MVYGNTSTAGELTAGTNGTPNDCAATGTPTYSALPGVGTVSPALFPLHCTVAATGAYAAQGTLAAGTSWVALLATYKAAPPPAPEPPAGSPRTGEDPKCERLRGKLKRQKRGLARASGEGKRARIRANVKDTEGRLKRLGCK